MWLRPIELLSFDGAILRLRAPNSYIRLWFESNFLGSLLKEIQELGHDVRVEFEPMVPTNGRHRSSRTQAPLPYR